MATVKYKGDRFMRGSRKSALMLVVASLLFFAADGFSEEIRPGKKVATNEEDSAGSGEGMSSVDMRLTPTDVAPSAGTSKLSLPTVSTVESKVKYGVDLDLELDAHADKLRNQSGGGLATQNFVSFRGALGEDTIAYIRPYFFSSYAPPSQSKAGSAIDSHNDWKMGDTALGIADSKFLTFGHEGTVAATGRIYLPTAEADRITGNNGSLYGKAVVTAPINSAISLSFNSINLWWNQSSNTYVNAEGKLDRNIDYELVQFGTVTWTIVKHLDLAQSIGMDYMFYRKTSDPVPADTNPIAFQRDVYLETTLSTDIIPHVSTVLGLLNEPYGNNPNGTEVGFYREGESYFYLNLYASL
jgi:hypothetical protein